MFVVIVCISFVILLNLSLWFIPQIGYTLHKNGHIKAAYALGIVPALIVSAVFFLILR